jgi:hypothetical protein
MASLRETITLPKGSLKKRMVKKNKKATPDARTAHYSLGIYDSFDHPQSLTIL